MRRRVSQDFPSGDIRTFGTASRRGRAVSRAPAPGPSSSPSPVVDRATGRSGARAHYLSETEAIAQGRRKIPLLTATARGTHFPGIDTPT